MNIDYFQMILRNNYQFTQIKQKKKKDTEKQRLQDRVKERAINSRDGGWGGMGEVIGEGNINAES